MGAIGTVGHGHGVGGFGLRFGETIAHGRGFVLSMHDVPNERGRWGMQNEARILRPCPILSYAIKF